MTFTLAEKNTLSIKIIGVGGGGGNALNCIAQNQVNGVELIAVDTRKPSLDRSQAGVKIQIGKTTTDGHGAGGDPETGRLSALECADDFEKVINGVDLLFITACLGGGTGTGAAPIIAESARKSGVLTVAVVTQPFFFEGKKRMDNAEEGLKRLQKHADAIIVIHNDRLLAMMDKRSSLVKMLNKADMILAQAVKGISDLINLHGRINADFADIKSVLKEGGSAVIGTGIAKGPNRATEAADQAINNKLLGGKGIYGAHGIVINISASEKTLTLAEFSEALKIIQEFAHEDVNMVFGVLYDKNCNDEMRITIVATGITIV